MAEFKEIVEDTHTDVLLNECDLDSEHKLRSVTGHLFWIRNATGKEIGCVVA
jgi:hypothetical protein